MKRALSFLVNDIPIVILIKNGYSEVYIKDKVYPIDSTEVEVAERFALHKLEENVRSVFNTLH